MQTKLLKLIPVIFALVGLTFVGGSIYVYRLDVVFRETAVVVQGTVIDNVYGSKGNTCPIILYLPKGSTQAVTFRHSSCQTPARFSIGDHVPVYYQTDHPTKGKIEDVTGPMIFGGIGLFFSAVGLGWLGHVYIRNRRRTWLLQHGIKVVADVIAVNQNQQIRVGSVSPWVITAQWLDTATNTMHTFASENIWFNPEKYLKNIDKKTVEVFIKQSNPKQHHIDLSFLPKQE